MAGHRSAARCCRGSTAVEFAIVAALFFALLLGIMQFGLVLFYWNTTYEATRMGARIAVVCDLDAAAVTNDMAQLFPMLNAASVAVSYQPAGCNVNTCQTVTVQVNPNVVVPVSIPFIALPTLSLPPASTTFTRESLQSTFAGTANPMCQ